GVQAWKTASPAIPTRPAAAQARARRSLVGKRRQHGHAAQEEEPQEHQTHVYGADDPHDQSRLGDSFARGRRASCLDRLELLTGQEPGDGSKERATEEAQDSQDQRHDRVGAGGLLRRRILVGRGLWGRRRYAQSSYPPFGPAGIGVERGPRGPLSTGLRLEAVGVLADTGNEEPLALHALHDAEDVEDDDGQPDDQPQDRGDAAEERYVARDDLYDPHGDPRSEEHTSELQ